MHTVLPGMPAPEAASFTDALFAFIPSDTDFTEYRKAGWWGLDMAITGDSWAYHTPQDDSAHLDQSILQHYGDMTLALTQDLLGTDLGAVDEESAPPVLMTAPWGIVALPPLFLRLLAVVALTIALSGVGLWANATSDEQVQESVTATVDADTATTTWEASSATQWGRDINGTTSHAEDLQAARCVRAEKSTDASANGDCEKKNPGPRVTITVSSPRDAACMLIEPVQGTMRDIVVDRTKVPGLEESGKSSESSESGVSKGSTRLMLTGLEAGQKATVSFTPPLWSPRLSAVMRLMTSRPPRAGVLQHRAVFRWSSQSSESQRL